jgi:hypothetical protein
MKPAPISPKNSRQDQNDDQGINQDKKQRCPGPLQLKPFQETQGMLVQIKMNENNEPCHDQHDSEQQMSFLIEVVNDLIYHGRTPPETISDLKRERFVLSLNRYQNLHTFNGEGKHDPWDYKKVYYRKCGYQNRGSRLKVDWREKIKKSLTSFAVSILYK